MYQVKVVATDRKDNPSEETLTAERLSLPIPITHQPPQVTLKLAGIEGDKAVLEGSATDTMVRLVDAAYAINGSKWTNVFPADGLFDSKSETFRFRTESLRPGTHVLVLRVRDAFGNVGSSDVLFNLPERK